MSAARQLTVAVVGAGTLVGEMLIQLLDERAFPVGQLQPLCSERSLGRTVSFRGHNYPLLRFTDFDLKQADLAFFCAGSRISRELAPAAAAAGCRVIDSTSAFRHEEDVPLVVPEVNAHAIELAEQRRIIASPGSAVIQLVVALKPLHDAAGLQRINVATYQAVSGAGREAVEELAQQSIALLSGRSPPAPQRVPRRIAFNCVPQIGDLTENGDTSEELRLMMEIRKVLEADTLRVNAITVRVPVFYGHSAAVSIETRTKLSPDEARAVLQHAPGVTLFDAPRNAGYPTAATEAANQDTVYVGRIREDQSVDRGLNLWVVADNIRKGAATNSVQIAETWAGRSI